MIIKLLRARLGRAEDGIALVAVIGTAAVMAVLVVAAVAFSVGGLQKTRSDQDWNAALAAAYAGVEEYQSLVSVNQGYIRHGNPLSTFTTPTLADASAPLT